MMKRFLLTTGVSCLLSQPLFANTLASEIEQEVERIYQDVLGPLGDRNDVRISGCDIAVTEWLGSGEVIETRAHLSDYDTTPENAFYMAGDKAVLAMGIRPDLLDAHRQELLRLSAALDGVPVQDEAVTDAEMQRIHEVYATILSDVQKGNYGPIAQRNFRVTFNSEARKHIVLLQVVEGGFERGGFGLGMISNPDDIFMLAQHAHEYAQDCDQ